MTATAAMVLTLAGGIVFAVHEASVARRQFAEAMNLAFLASDHEMLGDLFAERGKQADAREEFRSAFAGAASVAAGSASAQRTYLTSGRKLAADAAGAGDEAAALDYANKTRAAAEKAAAEKNAPTGVRVLVPQAYATLGEIYEILRRPAEARQWRERSLAAFRDLENQREFNSLHRDEMRRVEAALNAK